MVHRVVKLVREALESLSEARVEGLPEFPGHREHQSWIALQHVSWYWEPGRRSERHATDSRRRYQSWQSCWQAWGECFIPKLQDLALGACSSMTWNSFVSLLSLKSPANMHEVRVCVVQNWREVFPPGVEDSYHNQSWAGKAIAFEEGSFQKSIAPKELQGIGWGW